MADQFELKDNQGSMFKNPEFNSNGDMDDPNNFWGNGSVMVNGKKMSFRAYAKVGAKSNKPWWKLSLYEPKPQKGGGFQQKEEPMPWD
tara:strand:- start:1532 stop:1795 length:264 start_codon:yes stop_codon:yes gene_type:complete